MTHNFLLPVMQLPTRSPIGVIAISAPGVKNIMPTTSSAAPMRKQSRMLGEIGAIVKQSRSTMPMIGSTARKDSASFSRSLRQVFFKFSPRWTVGIKGMHQ